MKTRRFGRTGHMSTVAIFGAAAFSNITQADADRVMQQVIAAGVNHIDIAPSYGMAEIRVGPWMPRIRDQFFLGCKTMERTKEGAWREMHESLERLQTDHFDLYQIHAITSFDELDAATAPGGALEAIIQAREQGLTKHIGITGHGVDSPAIFREALHRFDFDSVLFPINFVQYANPYFRTNAENLIAECRQKDVGTMIIKSITKGPWGDRPHTHSTWYEPFSQAEEIQTAVNFVLSQEVTGVCTAGDTSVLPLVLQACENFTPMSAEEQETLIAQAGQYEPLFA
ncbi:MAG TPA: aldo/keto reductase [Anaerolineales bacterium]|nr:aldo/keto reductase [Anaerolineales bacterium]